MISSHLFSPFSLGFLAFFLTSQNHDANGNETIKPVITTVKTRIHKLSITCLPKTEWVGLKDLITKCRAKIWNYWDVDNYPLFLSVMDIPKKSWSIQKNKFVKLILEGRNFHLLFFSETSFVAPVDMI